MADKLIGADALTRAIADNPSDTSGYSPVYCQGVVKRQIEILDIMLNMNGTTEGEIRARAIDEFACALMGYKYGRTDGVYIEIPLYRVKEIAEQLKGEQNE